MVNEDDYFMCKINMSGEDYRQMIKEYPLIVEVLKSCELYENIFCDIQDLVTSSHTKQDFTEEFSSYEQYDAFMEKAEFLSVNLLGGDEKLNRFDYQRVKNKNTKFADERKRKFSWEK